MRNTYIKVNTMRKLICMTLAAVMALGLTACGGGDEKKEFADFSVQALMEDMLTRVTIDDPLTLTEPDMLDFFGIKGESMSEFAAVTCANGISAQEIVLVKAVDEDTGIEIMGKLADRMDARAAEAENYLPDQYAIISECQVARYGLYVAMIIHPGHEELDDLFLSYVMGEN